MIFIKYVYDIYVEFVSVVGLIVLGFIVICIDLLVYVKYYFFVFFRLRKDGSFCIEVEWRVI